MFRKNCTQSRFSSDVLKMISIDTNSRRYKRITVRIHLLFHYRAFIEFRVSFRSPFIRNYFLRRTFVARKIIIQMDFWRCIIIKRNKNVYVLHAFQSFRWIMSFVIEGRPALINSLSPRPFAKAPTLACLPLRITYLYTS